MTQFSSLNLRRGLESLPQELYDEIYALTLIAEPSTQIVIRSWKPPHLLHVDRSSRLRFATSYFDESTFNFPICIEGKGTIHYARLWLTAQSSEHLKNVEYLNVILEQSLHGGTEPPKDTDFIRQYLSMTLLDALKAMSLIPSGHAARRLAEELQVVYIDDDCAQNMGPARQA